VSLPSGEINLISGVVQVITQISKKVNLALLGPLIAFCMTVGGLGGCGAWMSGTARIPFVIGIDNYLPPWLAEIHPKWGTPANAILAQGVISSVFIVMSAIWASVKETYLLLIDATLILYFIPYIYIFAAFIAWQGLKGKLATAEHRKFDFPPFLGVLGIITTAFAMVLALVPPAEAKSPWLYEAKVIGGVLFFFLIGWWMFRSAKNKIQFDANEGNGGCKKNSKCE
jgi:amino acid transporter